LGKKSRDFVLSKKDRLSSLKYTDIWRNLWKISLVLRLDFVIAFPLNREIENLYGSPFIFFEKYMIHSFSLANTWFIQRNGKHFKTVSLITQSVQIVSIENFFV